MGLHRCPEPLPSVLCLVGAARSCNPKHCRLSKAVYSTSCWASNPFLGKAKNPGSLSPTLGPTCPTSPVPHGYLNCGLPGYLEPSPFGLMLEEPGWSPSARSVSVGRRLCLGCGLPERNPLPRWPRAGMSDLSRLCADLPGSAEPHICSCVSDMFPTSPALKGEQDLMLACALSTRPKHTPQAHAPTLHLPSGNACLRVAEFKVPPSPKHPQLWAVTRSFWVQKERTSLPLRAAGKKQRSAKSSSPGGYLATSANSGARVLVQNNRSPATWPGPPMVLEDALTATGTQAEKQEAGVRSCGKEVCVSRAPAPAKSSLPFPEGHVQGLSRPHPRCFPLRLYHKERPGRLG